MNYWGVSCIVLNPEPEYMKYIQINSSFNGVDVVSLVVIDDLLIRMNGLFSYPDNQFIIQK